MDPRGLSWRRWGGPPPAPGLSQTRQASSRSISLDLSRATPTRTDFLREETRITHDRRSPRLMVRGSRRAIGIGGPLCRHHSARVGPAPIFPQRWTEVDLGVSRPSTVFGDSRWARESLRVANDGFGDTTRPRLTLSGYQDLHLPATRVYFMGVKRREDLPVHQLGRSDAQVRETPNLAPSELFPGMQAVKPEQTGKFGTRTGRNERT